MDVYIVSILSLISMVFLIVGFLKKQLILILLSGILIFFLGLWILNGITHANDVTITTISNATEYRTDTHNYTITTSTTSEQHSSDTELLHKNTFTTSTGIILMIIGIFLIIVSGVSLFQEEDIEILNDED